jgi:acetolactate synthase-1/2/3 large subunit
MALSEMRTMCANGINIVACILNNGRLGMVEDYQNKKFGGRRIGTDISGPDFAAIARAYGATGITVDSMANLHAGLKQALAAEGPAIIDARTTD